VAIASLITLPVLSRGQGASGDVQSLHVQGNVWMLVSGSSNAAAQIGNDGVLLVDTLAAGLEDKLLAEVRRLAGDKPIRHIVNTHVHPDHSGGNEKVAAAGRSIVAGNFAGDVGQGAANMAVITAHEQVLNRMSAPTGKEAARPARAWPATTFFDEERDIYFNGEGIQLMHVPAAHTDGDVMVYFRKSDVIVAGDLYLTTTFPVVDAAQGGDFKGMLRALNRMIDIAIPRDKQEGGTYVIPGHGRLSDEADVVDYRDMNTAIRDRVQDAIRKGMTLDQVKAAKLARDHDPRYGGMMRPPSLGPNAPQATADSLRAGSPAEARVAPLSEGWTTDQYIEAVYKSLQPSATSGRIPATKPSAPTTGKK
jgi:glyoxylase-like metal-dependent hydrolase (beta-lactamase superfamily II)